MAVAHQFAGPAELLGRALLRTHLKDRLLFRHLGDHLLTLGKGMRHRLLAVDVFAGAQGGETDVRVPVVGRGHHDGVEIGQRAEFAEVAERSQATALASGASAVLLFRIMRRDLCLAGFEALRLAGAPGAVAVVLFVDIAQGGDLHIRLVEKAVHHLQAAGAETDHADGDPFVRIGPRGGEQAGGGGGRFQKTATGKRGGHGVILPEGRAPDKGKMGPSSTLPRGSQPTTPRVRNCVRVCARRPRR